MIVHKGEKKNIKCLQFLFHISTKEKVNLDITHIGNRLSFYEKDW